MIAGSNSDEVNLKEIIGEATDYDKKVALEVKNQRVGVKVSALLPMVLVDC